MGGLYLVSYVYSNELFKQKKICILTLYTFLYNMIFGCLIQFWRSFELISDCHTLVNNIRNQSQHSGQNVNQRLIVNKRNIV